MLIHTVLAYGQCLMPEVLKGIVNQTIPCTLMVISSERNLDRQPHRRLNMVANWREAFHYYDGDIFIGFDSDVVLTPKAIETLLARMGDNDIVTMATKAKCRNVFHSLFAVKVGKFLEFEDRYDQCPICLAIKKAREAGKKIEHIHDVRVGECVRQFVRRK